MDNEIKDCAKKIEDIKLECTEVLPNCSPISSLEDYLEWRDELCPDGRHKYLSVNMTRDEFTYLNTVLMPEDYIYLPDDIHMHGHFYMYHLDGRNRRIHMNSVCTGLFEDFYAMDKQRLHGSYFCEWFNDPADFNKYIKKDLDMMFCDMCNGFLFEYDLFQYDPCNECMNDWEFFNRI